MARISLGPIVSDASGKIAGTVFSRWKGRNYVRRLITPSNPQSVDQTAQRNAMARCVELWRSLTATLKTQLDTFATGLRMSGYNWFVGQNRVNEVTYDSAKLTPHNPDIPMIEDFATASGGAGIVTVTWTDNVVDGASLVHIYYRKVEPASEETEIHLHSTTAIATETKDVNGLDTGELYHIFACIGNAGSTAYGESDSGEETAG